ncbi:transcriptional regulator [Pusillimonas sp. T7-7]|uniref:IclR family transcriptional regulator n=1 Tax=Pusillimonas sp. (strain T7-7) TaxID=1007105 RepID=UPI0002084506|nr:IclR family transcriptional regulator [Pusillimonas sp. T7-7]AEC21527.1 transcriptional regulator [Pusillimonas sp. T7-7]
MRPDKNAEGADTLDLAQLQQHPQYASTLANGLAVLGCFAGGALALGNKDIAEQLNMARPTVSRLTFTLVGLGYLRRNPRTSKYSLGPAVLSLGYPLLSQLLIRQVGAAQMLKLSSYAQGPVSVGMRDRMQVVYVETIHSRETNETRPGIGSTRPLLRTAMGRAVLFGLPQTERDMVLKQLQRHEPGEWQENKEGLESAFAEIKRSGFCVVRGAWRSTLAAVAVPMQQPVNGMHLAFNLTVSSFSTTDDVLQHDLGPRLLSLVHNIEDMMGGR